MSIKIFGYLARKYSDIVLSLVDPKFAGTETMMAAKESKFVDAYNGGVRGE